MPAHGHTWRGGRRCVLILVVAASLGAADASQGGPKKVSGGDKVFATPAFWATADSICRGYGGAYWLREKKTQIEYEGGNWVTRRIYHSQIVVLDAAKMEDRANVSIAFGPASRIVGLECRTITSDGTVYELGKDQIFEKSLVPGFMLYSQRKAKVFAMPGYCDRCVLDIFYDIREEQPYLSDEFEFGRDIPVHASRYSYAINPVVFRQGLEVFYKCYNSRVTPREEAYDTPNGRIVQWTWDLADVRAFPDEDWMPPRETMIPWILLGSGERGQTEADWKGWAKWYQEAIADKLRSSRELRDMVTALVGEAATEREKIQAVANRVGTDVRYVAVSLEDGGWEPHEPREVLQNKYGDCKDMSVLTVAALQEAGIRAYPALLLTRDEGKVDKDLLVPRFNHMIVYIEGGDSTWWLDPTVAPCPLGYLPHPDRGVDALVIKPDGFLWARTPETSPFGSTKSARTLISLSADGTLLANTVLKYEGDFAAPMTRNLDQLSKDDLQAEIEDKAKSCLSGVNISQCDLVSITPSPPCVVLAAQYTKPSGAVCLGDRMALKLDFLSPLALTLAEMGTTRERRYPLWFPYPWAECDTVCVEGPSGWIPDALPDDLRSSAGYGSCEIAYSLAGPQVIVIRRFALSGDLVQPDDFGRFVKFWQMARDRAIKEIVFRKL